MAKGIDFATINQAALGCLRSLVERWLPGGRFDGHEYKALNPRRADARIGSFSINLLTGMWADFASGDKGGDPVSLCAFLFHDDNQGAAAKALADELGIVNGAGKNSTPPPEKRRSPWRPCPLVPAGAAPPPVAHIKRGRPEMRWEYRDRVGALLGVVYRFRTSDGGKEVLPCVYAVNTETGAEEWRWLSFTDPRPLYGLHRWRDGLPVLVVEGEKCVDAAYAVLGEAFNVISWPGGGKAVANADWTLLEGRKVIIWPDADEPGLAAAEKIAAIIGKLDANVRLVDIAGLGVVEQGYDIADAIADGRTASDLKSFIRANLRKPAQAESEGKKAPAKDSNPDWRRELIRKPRGGLEDCRENVFLILHHDPAWAGVIGFDLFSERVVKLKESPTGQPAGEWTPEDDYALGLWLAQRHEVVIKSEAAIVAGVAMAAHKNKFHPVREYLSGLPAWDGVERCDYWLSECLGAEFNEYTMLAGRLFLIGMVARIMRPGCAMQNMLVLEGRQGKGKSTALRILAGEWFADTPFKLGDKDAYMSLKGVWLYEIAELDSFNRSETTAVKAFISIQTDHYREPYGRRMVDRPRQVVFGGTTNQGEYLKDTTGNRRTWPIRTGEAIDLVKLIEWRDQLFAEAMARFERGERWHPSREEERALFRPCQEEREISDPWFEVIASWLNQPELMTMPAVTAVQVLQQAVGVKPEKMDGARSMTTRVGMVMAKLGWGKQRQGSGLRLWEYLRPAQAESADKDDPLPL